MNEKSWYIVSYLLCVLSDLSLAVAGVRSQEVEVNREAAQPLTEATPTRLAWFLLGVLRVAAETEQALEVMAGVHPQPHLPQLLGRLLLLLSSLISGEWSCSCVASIYHGTLVQVHMRVCVLPYPPSLPLPPWQVPFSLSPPLILCSCSTTATSQCSLAHITGLVCLCLSY